MGLNNEERKTVVAMQVAKAHRFLGQAERRREEEEWDNAVNRYYYACFHMSMALLISHALSAKTHMGLIRTVSEHFIKTGLLPVEFGSFLSRLMNLRQKADYNCAFDVTPKDIEMCITMSPKYIEATELLIKQHFKQLTPME